MGHLLEHVQWERVPSFLHDEVAPALTADGSLCVVGPDVYRAIQMWHDGSSTWEWVVAAIEDDVSQFDLQEEHLDDDEQVVTFLESDNATQGWPEARHKWNCYQERLERVVTHALPEFEVYGVPIDESGELREWPLVAFTRYQCAVVAHKRGV